MRRDAIVLRFSASDLNPGGPFTLVICSRRDRTSPGQFSEDTPRCNLQSGPLRGEKPLALQGIRHDTLIPERGGYGKSILEERL